MEISVYLSKKFCNEDTPLYKIEKIEHQKIYQKNNRDENILIDRDYYQPIPSSETSLSKLYDLGWRIASTQQLHSTWMFVFLERG